MRATKPKVRLLATPSIELDAMGDYLTEIGGEEWYERMVDDDDAAPAEDLTEFGGRMCYRSWTEGLNANVTRVRKDKGTYFENLIGSGHGSVLEHANFTFLFQDVSRVFTHELVRHRAGAAYSQESMRFVRLTDIPFWFPDWATQDEELMERSINLLNDMEAHQRWMAEHFELDSKSVPFQMKKFYTSFMRRFAPDGVSTAIMFTANVRTLRHVIAARTNQHAEEEIRLVFDEVAQIMKKESPLLFADFEKNEAGEWVPEHAKV